MEQDNLDYVGRRVNEKMQVLLNVSSMFTKAGLTGTQGLAVFEGVAALMTESRKERKEGGVLAAIASLYQDKELPIPLMELVLVQLLPKHSYRENIANECERIVEQVTHYHINLDQPWRDCMGELFAKLAKEQEEGRRGLQAARHLPKHVETEE